MAKDETKEKETTVEAPANGEASGEPAGSGDEAPESSGGRRVREYDFRRPQYLSAEQMRNLQRVHAAAADTLQERLTRVYGGAAQVRLERVEEEAFGLLLSSLAPHTYTCVLNLEPLKARGILYVESRICLSFVDRVLGGFSKEPPQPRPLTAIDEATVEGVIERMLGCLREHWRDFCDIKLTVEDRRTEPDMVELWNKGEPVLVVTLAMSGGLGEGLIRLCMPVARLKAAVDGSVLRAAGQAASPEQAAEVRKKLMRSLERTKLSVAAAFEPVEVPMRNLMNLRTGDILRVDHPVDEPILLRVGRKARFAVKMGLRGRRKAVQVVERLDSEEE